MKSPKLLVFAVLLSCILIANQIVYAEQTKSILIIGDSIGKGIGETLKKAFAEIKITVDVQNNCVVSSGLLSPKFYNWNKSLRELIEKKQFDIIIISMGTNDIRKESGDTKWKIMYTNKFKEFINIVTNSKTKVFVLSIPPMRDEPLKSHVNDINQIIQSVISEFNGNYNYIDTTSNISNNKGEYIKDINVDGKQVHIRTDGIHFTPFGYYTLGKVIAITIDQREKE